MEQEHQILPASVPRGNDLRERLMDFSVRVIRGLEALRHHPEGKYLVGQLFRSATAVGANYEEAQAAESRADFVHKMQLALKEARETAYWLQLSKRAGWFEDSWRDQVLQESGEITRILAKSVVTAKRGIEASRRKASLSHLPASHLPPYTFSFFTLPFALFSTFAFCLLPFALC